MVNDGQVDRLRHEWTLYASLDAHFHEVAYKIINL
jgi:hypothetical protein